MKKILLFSDLLATILAFFNAYFLRDVGVLPLLFDYVQPLPVYLIVLPITTILLLTTFHKFGLYRVMSRATALSEVYNLLKGFCLWLLFVMAGSYLFKFEFSRIILFLYGFLTIFYVISGRLILRHLLRSGWRKVRVMVIGQEKLTRHVIDRLNRIKNLGFVIVNQPIGMSEKQIGKVLKKKKIDEVWIADKNISQQDLFRFIDGFRNYCGSVRVVSNIFSRVTGEVSVDNIDTLPLMKLGVNHQSFWFTIIKRGFDIILGFFLLLFTFPLWVVVIIAIHLDSPGPVLLRQKRIGLRGRSFFLYKFRTMFYPQHSLVPPHGIRDPRITRIGRFLRRTSLDELPQLINVILGEMTMVGPRPELPHIVSLYKTWQKKRLDIKPGLTGLWQIVGRKDLPLSQHLEYDFYYMNNQSFLFDLAILLKTVIYVILGKGAY